MKHNLTKKEVQEWAKERQMILLKRSEFDILIANTDKLAKLDSTCKLRLFDEDGDVFALQG